MTKYVKCTLTQEKLRVKSHSTAQHSTALTSFLSFFSKTYQLTAPLLNIGINNRHAGELSRSVLRGDFFAYYGTSDSRKCRIQILRQKGGLLICVS